MQILKRTLAVVAAVTLTAGAVQAQAPNFAGQWELNAAKSDFGQMAGQAPTKITMTVEQTATTVKVAQAMATPQGDMNTSTEYGLDGKQTSSPGPQGMTMLSTAKFDGPVLAIESKMSREGMDMTRITRWTLAPDGKSLTVDQNLVTPMGPFAMKLVFDKK